MTLEIRGKTTDGRWVLGKVFFLYETHGLPLDVVFDVFANNGALPCWITLYEDGLRAGIKKEKLLTMIETAIADSLYGPELSQEVLARLRAYVPAPA